LRGFARFRPENGLAGAFWAIFGAFLGVMSICEHLHMVKKRPHARIGPVLAPHIWHVIIVLLPHLAPAWCGIASISTSAPTPLDARNTEAGRRLNC